MAKCPLKTVVRITLVSKIVLSITHYQMYKLTNNMDVTTDVLRAICNALDVKIEEIMEWSTEPDKGE